MYVVWFFLLHNPALFSNFINIGYVCYVYVACKCWSFCYPRIFSGNSTEIVDKMDGMVHKMTWSCSDSQTFFMKSNVKWLVKRPLIFSKRFRDMSDEEEGRDMTYRRRQRRRSKAPLRYRDEPSDEEEKQCHREVEERGTRSSRGRWGHLGRL